MKPGVSAVNWLRGLALLLRALGFWPYKARHLFAVRFWLRDWRKFERLGGRVTHPYPILSDFTAPAGATGGHYFHQDLLVASMVFQSNPDRHVDVGSRIDGFVAHVAMFRKIEVLDVRSLPDLGHPNITFREQDLMNPSSTDAGVTDSLSCLHTLEHFGLGRYGDSVDPGGHLSGFDNLLRMVGPGGVLYLSFPIGQRDEVHFNAHRVFHPTSLLERWGRETLFKLERFDFVDDDGVLHREASPYHIADIRYGCGIYTLRKS